MSPAEYLSTSPQIWTCKPTLNPAVRWVIAFLHLRGPLLFFSSALYEHGILYSTDILTTTLRNGPFAQFRQFGTHDRCFWRNVSFSICQGRSDPSLAPSFHPQLLMSPRLQIDLRSIVSSYRVKWVAGWPESVHRAVLDPHPHLESNPFDLLQLSFMPPVRNVVTTSTTKTMVPQESNGRSDGRKAFSDANCAKPFSGHLCTVQLTPTTPSIVPSSPTITAPTTDGTTMIQLLWSYGDV